MLNKHDFHEFYQKSSNLYQLKFINVERLHVEHFYANRQNKLLKTFDDMMCLRL
jgi:hypothetical protein